jgi:hypothetical protein
VQAGQAPYTATGYPAGYQSSAAYPGTAYPGAYPSAGYPSAGYLSAGYPPQGTSWGAPRRTNGLAIASLACACAGIIPFLFGIPSVLGIIFGFVARNQIRNARGMQDGSGLALAGIIVGFSLIGLFILAIVLVAIFNPSSQPVSVPAQ